MGMSYRPGDPGFGGKAPEFPAPFTLRDRISALTPAPAPRARREKGRSANAQALALLGNFQNMRGDEYQNILELVVSAQRLESHTDQRDILEARYAFICYRFLLQ